MTHLTTRMLTRWLAAAAFAALTIWTAPAYVAAEGARPGGIWYVVASLAVLLAILVGMFVARERTTRVKLLLALVLTQLIDVAVMLHFGAGSAPLILIWLVLCWTEWPQELPELRLI